MDDKDFIDGIRRVAPAPMKNAETLEETLRQRGEVYGDFNDNALIAQWLKNVCRRGRSWQHMTFTQREAVDVICSKISRIVTGNADYADNWDDIAGYARITKDRLVTGRQMMSGMEELVNV